MATIALNEDVKSAILELLSVGYLITSICRLENMPSLSTVQRVRRLDPEFDSAVWEAQAAGLMVQRDLAFEILADEDSTSTDVQRAREMLHDVRGWASKLVSRMVERYEPQVSHAVAVVGWQLEEPIEMPSTLAPFLTGSENP
jgi:hypothetical protein